MTATAPTDLNAVPVDAATVADKASVSTKATIAIGALTAAAVMDGLNAIIFDIAGNHMAGYASAAPDEAAWLNHAYFMAKVCGLPMTALLIGWLGTRRLLQWAIVLVMIASVGCWLSRDLIFLVLCRALQGLGGAAILAGGQSWFVQSVPTPAPGTDSSHLCPRRNHGADNRRSRDRWRSRGRGFLERCSASQCADRSGRAGAPAADHATPRPPASSSPIGSGSR
jgi:hypothetical protein